MSKTFAHKTSPQNPTIAGRLPWILALSTAALSSSVLLPETASAQARATRAASRPNASSQSQDVAAPLLTVRDIPEIVVRLNGSDLDQARAAIDELAIIDNPAIVAPLAALLRSAPPDALTDRALEALRNVRAQESFDVFVEFTHHLRAGARRRAYQGLSALRTNPSEATRNTPQNQARLVREFERGLRDSDRSVRSACASALGDLGSRASVPVLFQAFERGVVEAAASIGKLGDQASIERFSTQLGTQPLSIMLSGYDQYLRRNDISEEAKTGIVNRLGEVAGPAVREFLAQYYTTFEPRDRSRLRQLVSDTIRRIPGAAR